MAGSHVYVHTYTHKHTCMPVMLLPPPRSQTLIDHQKQPFFLFGMQLERPLQSSFSFTKPLMELSLPQMSP